MIGTTPLARESQRQCAHPHLLLLTALLQMHGIEAMAGQFCLVHALRPAGHDDSELAAQLENGDTYKAGTLGRLILTARGAMDHWIELMMVNKVPVLMPC